MNLKKILKHNTKLYIVMGIIIILGTIGITFAVTSNFSPIAVNITTSTIDADITYDEGTNSSEITSTGKILPIADSVIEQYGESIVDERVIKAQFNVSGLESNPANTIYDIALYSNDTETSQGIDCELRTEDVKWKLYKNSVLLSSGNLSPKFDVMDNGRLVLTNTQQDLTTTSDKYTFILWISESCTGDITTCDPSQDQSKYLNKTINASLKIELATKSKKTLTRVTSDELSCDYTSIDIPVCNTLTYNTNDQTLLNSSNYYTIENNTGNLAGSYKTILKLNEGYKWSDGTTNDKTINCDIKKKEVTITTLPQTISYGTSLSTNLNNLTVEGLVEGHTLKSVLISQNNIDESTRTIKASNAVIIDSNNNDVTNNYEITYKNTGALTVNCMNSSTLPTTIDYTYTGESFTGITGGNNIDIQGVSTATEAGTYEVTVTPKNNYCWTDGTTEPKTLTWSIIENVVTVNLNNLVTETNGTSTLYYSNGTYYANSSNTQAMTTTSNPITVPIKVGYSFDGYYTEEDGNGTQMIDSNGYATEALLSTDPSVSTYSLRQGITLYANWIQKTYTITYDANGGTGAPSPQTKTHGETITLSDKTPIHSEKAFSGWSTDKNATSATYSQGDSFTVNANITLYAIYTTPEYIDFTITSENRNMIGYTDSTTELTIPSTFQTEDGTWYKVTAIGDAAFDGCENLTNITIPDSVTSIGNESFAACESLDNIVIPNSVTSIGNYAFIACAKLQEIIIPDSVTSIGDGAFDLCISLTSVTLSNNLTTIAKRLFNECHSLTSIIIPNGVTSIGEYAFSSCTNLTSVNIPDSVEVIGEFAFDNCENLTNITIPDSVKYIESNAFNNCTSLTNIIIPGSVIEFGDEVFRDCSNLTSVTLSDGITSIGGFMFQSCTSLTNIIIPDSVTSIALYAFSGCTSLTNVYYTGTETQWNEITIDNYNSENAPLNNATKHFEYVAS